MLNKLFSRHAFVIILICVFILPFMTRGSRKALRSNDNNVQDWLPKEYQETADFAWFKQHFDNETFVLVTWDGCTVDDPRLELFERKVVPNTTEPDAGALFRKIETTRTVLDRLMAPPLNLSEDDANKRLRGLFLGPDDKQACGILTLTAEGKKDLRATLDKLYAVCNKELGLPRDRVKMGGPPVDNVAISVEGERTLIRLFIPAGIVGLSLAYWCLRSVRLTTMVFGTALYAAAICLSMVWYSGNSMNAILLTMPAVVYVAGISGAIHFANYYRDSAVEGGVDGAPARAIKHAWLPCILSAGTTAAGLFSLYTSELMPIKMFGVFSALGVVATLFLLFLFLPAWMQLWPMKRGSLLDGAVPKAEDIALPAKWRNVLAGVVDHHHWVLAALILVMCFCGYGLTKVNTSIKLTKLFSDGAEIIRNYGWLEEHLGPLVPMEVVVKIDPKENQSSFLERMELVDRIQQQMEGINGIGNTMSVVTYAPPLEVKRAGPFISKRTMRGILNKKLEDHRDEYLKSGFLAMDGDVELWRISARVGALNDIDYGEFKNDIQKAVEPVLAAERERLTSAAEKEAKKLKKQDGGPVKQVAFNEPVTTPKTAPQLGEGSVEIVGDRYGKPSTLSPKLLEPSSPPATKAPGQPVTKSPSPAVTKSPTLPTIAPAKPPLVPAPETTKVTKKIASTNGLDACYTGLVPLVYKAQRSMLNGLAWNFVTDVLTITAVMIVVFRDVAAGLVLLIPSIFPIMIVFGLMGWFGVVIDVGTIMTPTVALGVSVDDVVHFLIWYRRGLTEGKSRRDAIMLAYEGCARAMYQSWSVLGLGLAVFALSTFVPTQRFGAMMFCLLTAALVSNLVLLPCILRSPLGWFFLRRLRAKVARYPERYPVGGTHLQPHLPSEPHPHVHVDPAQPMHPSRRPPALQPDRSERGAA